MAGTQDNPKRVWKALNQIANIKTKSTKDVAIDKITVEGRVIADRFMILELLNDYFVHVGIEGHDSIEVQGVQLVRPSLIKFKSVTPCEIAGYVANLKNNVAAADGIPAQLYKILHSFYPDIFTAFVNHSLTTSSVPPQLKHNIIHPVYKGGARDDMANYRPIAIASNLSKILEMPVYDQLTQYFESINFFYAHQYGFRKTISTADAAFETVATIQSALDQGLSVSGLFLDVKKAFDSVNHTLLLKKLRVAGVGGDVISWMENYLSGRTQSVVLSGDLSSKQQVLSGVPQGSILGPLLFKVFLNDITKLVLKGRLNLYADDANVIYSATTLDSLFNGMQEDLLQLFNWYKSNGLSLNLTKTRYMLFSPKPLSNVNYALIANGINIQRASSVKSLGLHLDERLKWDIHIAKVKSSILPVLGLIFRNKSYLHVNNLKKKSTIP